MTRKWFITGTDTDVGKTYVSSKLVKYLVNSGKQVAVMKPISAGCTRVDGQLQNDDALELMGQANVSQTYAQVNPIAVEPPVAPHLMLKSQPLQQTNSMIDLGVSENLGLKPDILLAEGAGGWRLPLGHGAFLSDFAKRNEFDVVLVVGLRLGCLNHAILTAEAIKQDGLNLIGWVANSLSSDMDFEQENIDTLVEELSAPLLAKVPYAEKGTDSCEIQWSIELDKD